MAVNEMGVVLGDLRKPINKCFVFNTFFVNDYTILLYAL